jgi:hypothetical protein
MRNENKIEIFFVPQMNDVPAYRQAEIPAACADGQPVRSGN